MGVAPLQMAATEGFLTGLRKSAGASAFGQQMAELAHSIYVEAGQGGSFEAGLYQSMAKTAEWQDVHFDLLAPVYRALAGLQNQVTGRTMHKQAEEGLLPAGLKWMLGTGLVAGTGLGTLHWALNRDATADDAQSKSLTARTDLYRQLAKEISSELQANPPPDMVAALRNKNRTEKLEVI